MKIALIGFGNVGQNFVRILHDKSVPLRRDYGFHAELVAVGTRSKGTLYHPDGLDLAGLLHAAERGHLIHYPDQYGLTRDWDIETLIRQCNADVLIECSTTDLKSGQPALDYCRAALDTGKHVVMANKGPVVVAYAELMERARQAGKQCLFEGTVMAGTPSIRLAQQALAGCSISEARGIVNGTTNYILTQMEGGLSYADALKQAQDLGYAEADPEADVGGWDAAGKVIIFSAVLFGKVIAMRDIQVQGITQITVEDVAEAKAAGERWKLIARVTPDGGSVQPMRIPMSNPLAGVSGATNAITYTTDLMGDVTLIGAGAGGVQTAFALLSDVLDIARYG